MTVITLPPLPPAVPPLAADPGSVRTFASDLLAASARVDDLGSFVAGAAQVPTWQGRAATAYHQSIRPTGRRADAMSLALRHVSRRADQHADTLQRLLERHAGLDTERRHLLDRIAALRAEADGAPAEDAAGIQDACDDCARQVRGFVADLEDWVADLHAEEQAMREELTRVLTLDQVERRYGGRPDPADGALDSMPGADASPQAVRAWWDGLTEAQQQALVAASPGSIGNRDGVPPWARDAANHVALDRDLAGWGLLEEQGLLTADEERWLENARSAQDAVDIIGQRLDPITREPVVTQLYLYDPAAFDGDGAVAVSAGDLGTADNIAVVVPGMGTDGESAQYQADRAGVLYEAARNLDGSRTNASMFWIGYDAPDNVPWDEGWDVAGVATEDLATRGGERLADAVDGLRASRDGEPAHLTAIGHSYGSTTTGHAAHDHGLPVDDIVLVGSPGAGGDTNRASDLGIDPDHVWAGANSRDPVANLGNHGWVHGETLGGAGLGDDPAEDDFGATRFQAESTSRTDDDSLLSAEGRAQHSLYFDPDTESLYNIAQVVNGHYDAVLEADPVTDPWWREPQDPEWDREPTTPDTDGRP